MRDRERRNDDVFAPKGQQSIAQGFNPGLGILKRRALNGHQIWYEEPKSRVIVWGTSELSGVGRHFQGAPFRNDQPRVKTLGYGLLPLRGGCFYLKRARFHDEIRRVCRP